MNETEADILNPEKIDGNGIPTAAEVGAFRERVMEHFSARCLGKSLRAAARASVDSLGRLESYLCLAETREKAQIKFAFAEKGKK